MKSRLERRDAMLEAVEGGDGFQALRSLVQGLAGEGVDLRTLLDDLDQLRPLVAEAEEDAITDVMDLVVGYCTPTARIGPYSWTDPRNPLRDYWS
jgi:hypothetical protein